uniref:DNA-directed RNA polymerase subunit beta n=1 Tax=Talaromyces marneffei PM1 TaxID=1077442 RepID=A0A093VSV9_TALMA
MATSQEALKTSENCDEGMPECCECQAYGVCCNYDIRIPDLQPRYASSQKLDGKIQASTSTALVVDPSSTGEFKLELADGNLGRLQRFKIRTAMSLGPPELRHLYEHEVYELTLKHPFLMHFVQTVTSIHDRYLSPISDRRTVEEIYHWTKGVTLFNKKLSTPLRPDDRDAVWAAASMLGVITFASIENQTLEKSWPLASTLSAEPEWLKMGQGKSMLLSLAQPNRADSIFHGLFSTLRTVELSLETVPSSFMKLYELDALLEKNNPYATPLINIFAPLSMESQSSLMSLFYGFNNCMQDAFGRLVVNKDPRALLLMAYWYSKIRTGQWWLRRRAVIEGRATCTYLERYCAHDSTIQDLLQVPRQVLFNLDL